MDGELEGKSREGGWESSEVEHAVSWLGGQCEIRIAERDRLLLRKARKGLLMNAMSATLLRYSNLSIRSRESPH